MAVEGVREVLAAFDRFGGDVQKTMRMAVARSLGRIQGDAKRRCSYGAGRQWGGTHLRDQILTQLHVTDPMGAVFVERVGIGGYYGTDNRGIWVEYGTDVRYTKRGAYRGRAPGRPFMGPAAEAERPAHLSEMQAILDASARRF